MLITTEKAATLFSRTGLSLWFLLAAGLTVLGSLGLPWFSFVFFSDQQLTLGMTGLQALTTTHLETTSGVVLYRSSLWLVLAPLAGLLPLVLVAFNLDSNHSRPWHGPLAIFISVAAAAAVWNAYTVSDEIAQKLNVAVEIQWGLLLTLLALLLQFSAGIFLLQGMANQDTGLRASLDAFKFMAPSTALVLVFFFVPAVILFVLSLTNLSSNNFSEPWTYVGLENYRRLFADPFLPKILGNTFRYVALTLLLFNVGLALFVALMTTYVSQRASFLFRTLWLLPRITPSVVLVLMWQRIAQQPPYGILNQFLGWLGITFQPNWIPEAPWVFVILINGYVGASFGVRIFSAALDSIPSDITIAAKMDGAGNLAVIRDITLPLLRWPLLFVVTYQTLTLLFSFEYILLLTNGGPGLFTTEVWALTAYKRALQTYFGSNQWAYGAAWGFILVLIGAILSMIYLRLFRFNKLVEEPKIDVL